MSANEGKREYRGHLYESGPNGVICANCDRAQIAHHPALRYCKSKDGRRWRKSTFKPRVTR